MRLHFRLTWCCCSCPADAIIEYADYLDARRHANWNQPDSSFAFWLKSMHRYPTLAPLALKALDFPLSSISAERTFAMGRAIDLPCRRSQSRSTFCREVFLRVNRALAVRELVCALEALNPKH